MAFLNFVIYAKTDFSSVDFNGNIVTNSVITPIYVTVEDNDSWLGGSVSPFNDANGQQTISSSSDPSLIGLSIALNQPTSFFESTLADNSGPTPIRIVDLAIGGANNYVLPLDDGVSAELSTSTTYNDNSPGHGSGGVHYSTASMPSNAPGQ